MSVQDVAGLSGDAVRVGCVGDNRRAWDEATRCGPPKTILAVTSGGGHWSQLQLLRPAFAGCDVVFACTHPCGEQSVRLLTDCNARRPLCVLQCLFQVARLLTETRPDVVVSTGAAPGALAVLIGKLSGAQTIWVDSVANVERISLSGRLVRHFSDLWLTQWPELAKQCGARFEGRVL